MQTLRTIYAVVTTAYDEFLQDDGWAIASHIALSALMALFPFLIFVTALAGYLFGSKTLADEVARIILETWPHEVADAIAREIHNVLTSTRGDILTFGVGLSVYFASSGVESLRIGLNRAYDIFETRSWWLLRLESIAYVLVGALALIAMAFLIVLAPLIWRTAERYLPWIEPLSGVVTFTRVAIASLLLIVALVIAHMWLPSGRRRLRSIVPGVLATLALWLIGGIAFGRYLAEFAGNYVSTYAGLASAMIALVFLYVTAAIFIYGGELNAAIWRLRKRKG